MFGKSIKDLTLEDIRKLILEEVPEDESIEYKKTLPAKKGIDTWFSEQKIGEYARNQIVSEIVAFANRSGGTLVIGIDESDDSPKRAKDITPLTQAHDLADRFKLIFRDCIDPKLPSIEVRAILTNDAGDGVVVIYVPKSLSAPHRNASTKECTIRRNDRAEDMNMREIQDMTLNVEKDIARIDNYFSVRKKLFDENIKNFDATCHGIRVSATPLYRYQVKNLGTDRTDLDFRPFSGLLNGSRLNLPMQFPPNSRKPILRGVRGEFNNLSIHSFFEVYENGNVEFCMFIKPQDNEGIPYKFFPTRLFAIISNVADKIHNLKVGSDLPDIEYALEVQLSAQGRTVGVPYYFSHDVTAVAALPPNSVVFPVYAYNHIDELAQLYTLIDKDFWNYLNSSYLHQFEFK